MLRSAAVVPIITGVEEQRPTRTVVVVLVTFAALAVLAEAGVAVLGVLMGDWGAVGRGLALSAAAIAYVAVCVQRLNRADVVRHAPPAVPALVPVPVRVHR